MARDLDATAIPSIGTLPPARVRAVELATVSELPLQYVAWLLYRLNRREDCTRRREAVVSWL
ncbi:MAG: hypothetical protein ACO3NZ_16080 [Pirellulales bacterium]